MTDTTYVHDTYFLTPCYDKALAKQAGQARLCETGRGPCLTAILFQSQVKVAEEPQEGGREIGQLGFTCFACGTVLQGSGSLDQMLKCFKVKTACACADADVLCHLRHEGEAVERRLIDAAHLVVDEQAGQQHRQREDLRRVLPSLQGGIGAPAVQGCTLQYLIISSKAPRVPGRMHRCPPCPAKPVLLTELSVM